MSGRGLSFTGGTIDKLESIPGWTAELDEPRFRRQLAEIGLVIAAQTANLAPADKTLYALRDVTGTVPSLPLIASSIMCKKLAAGADAIVLDVKCGHGAFMETLEAAQQLARLMVAIGKGSGRSVRALITQMEQPLGRAVGNALEVKEALETLAGNGPADFAELVEWVCIEMLQLGSHIPLDEAAARQQVRSAIASGAALEKFRQFVAAQGGDAQIVDQPDRLPQAPVVLDLPAAESGYIHRIDSRAIGLAVVDLGGGRRKKGDAIDYRVGTVVHAKVGNHVSSGDPLCTIHAADHTTAEAILPRLRSAFTYAPDPAPPLPILYDRIG
jgi:pyrimidine-nucleoside phosphorylase